MYGNLDKLKQCSSLCHSLNILDNEERFECARKATSYFQHRLHCCVFIEGLVFYRNQERLFYEQVILINMVNSVLNEMTFFPYDRYKSI
jgi:hypothetical protein